jgi:hypothetical protein
VFVAGKKKISNSFFVVKEEQPENPIPQVANVLINWYSSFYFLKKILNS